MSTEPSIPLLPTNVLPAPGPSIPVLPASGPWDDARARATLVFGSSGAVQAVTVTSAGDAEACIKTALLKAKVAPFAEPSFTASANVRHN